VNDDWFEAQRPRLMAITYGMLGSVMEAEDVVQDAWLRWQAVDKTQIDQPAAFLTTITTRLAIDQLRSARRRRETYVGPWLPERIVREHGDDPADVVAEAERLSMALLTAMERLDPIERAVLLLRETFDFDHAEIADVVDKSPAACRQIAKRARERVGDPTRRRPVDNPAHVLAPFLAAIATGDADALMKTLAADVIAWSDGGGIRRAARQPVPGAERVAKFLLSIVETGLKQGGSAQVVVANGGPALLVSLDGELHAVMTLDIDDGLITAIRSVLNPEKLGYAERVTAERPDR
jgi:RNA polymerase sigma-70 factor, ECF subfamily